MEWIMGNVVIVFVCCFWLRIKFWRLFYVVMLGFDKSGKIVILYWSKWKDWKERIVLILGFNVEIVWLFKDLRFKIWDVSGKEYLCLFWKVYVWKMDVIIFVVDSVNEDRIEEVKEELFNFVNFV